MTTIGQLILLAALVVSGYSAFAAILAWQKGHRGIQRTGHFAGLLAALALSAVSGILIWALATRDFHFAYVAQYTSQALSWQYAVSAFWVGQAGSLLLWAWMLAVLALAYRFWPRRQPHPLREPAYGLLMAYVCFLVAVMAFAADPMQPSLSRPDEGGGLSPLLQHPAMLWHPPVVFLGYAGWAIPCALALMALAGRRLDDTWIAEARPWMLLSWLVLGLGILLGAQWAYEELGWGGYWAWDPVENGSLIPWLTGTALIHAAMVWQHRGGLKKTTCALAVAAFGLCNFATFLTRSGIFSSLHAFSQSSIGWMFLGLMAALAVAGVLLITGRRALLVAERPIQSLWSRETAVVLASIALVLLAATAAAGTILVPLSGPLIGRRVVLGVEFYNSVLIPTGIVLLLTTAPVPLLRWGKPPSLSQRMGLLLASIVAMLAAVCAWILGVRNSAALAVTALAVLAVASLVIAAILDARKIVASHPRRRQYAGFLIHSAFVCLALGVTGSSVGTRRHDLVMTPGEVVQWAGRSIHFTGIVQRDLPEIHVIEANLEVSVGGRPPYVLLPAQHLHTRHDQWTTEVALHSTWLADFYVVFYYAEADGSARLLLIENPMMRWLWASGWIAALATLLRFLPSRAGAVRSATASRPATVPHLQRPRRLPASVGIPGGAE